MRVCILGSVALLDDGAPVRMGGPKERAVLAALAVNANTVVSEGLLIDAVWGDDAPASAVPTLRSYISRLRRSMGAPADIAVETRPPGYLLRIGPECFDAASAERLLARARRDAATGDLVSAVDSLSTAAALWTGPSVAEFAAEPFAQAEATRLDELRVVIDEERLDAELGLGHHREILADLEGLCSAHPLRERLWALRMSTLYRSGRQGEALRAYQQLRRQLRRELGIDPSREVRALDAAILAQDATLNWRSPLNPGFAAGPRFTAGGAHNVPSLVSSFVGRHAERDEVLRILGTARLMTLVGTPGVGKTRFAVELASDLVASHPDGVWVVELAPVTDPALVPQAVATVLGVRERPGVDLPDTLAGELARRRVLLVLDNCEHLVAGCAAFAERLLEACPGLVILATSREPLGLEGEWVRRLEPLSVPPAGDESYQSLVAHDSVRLFAERAATTAARGVLTSASTPTVAEICRRLEGIPLAIELAAARLDVLSPTEIVDQLEERFRLLRTSTRRAPTYHSSLLATLEWSHNLLSEPEATLLRRLSVFAGGCSLDAAEVVCVQGDLARDDVLELLDALVRKSLIHTDRSQLTTRFGLLDTVREYASQKLWEAGERDDISRRHCDWAVALAERAEPELTSGTRAGWLERLDAEQDNVRAAFEWASATGRPEILLRLSAALTQFWWLQGHTGEGRHLLDRALSADPGEASPFRARAMWGSAYLIGSSGDVTEALPVAKESLALAERHGDQTTIGRAASLVGLLTMYRSPPQALPLLEGTVRAARVAGDARHLSSALCTLGTALLLVGECRAARSHLAESLGLARHLENRSQIAAVLGALGHVALTEGDYPTADALLREALCMAQEMSERGKMAIVLSLLGELARNQGDYARAGEELDQALDLAREVGRPFLVARCLCFLGHVALAEGDAGLAAARFGESISMARTLGLGYLIARCLLGQGQIAAMAGDVGPGREVLEEAVAVAQAAGDRQAVAAAMVVLADLARQEGLVERACSLCHQAMSLQDQIGDLPGLASALETAAGLQDSNEAAVRLLGAAQALRDARGYARPPVSARRYHHDVARALASLDHGVREWAEGAALSVGDAVVLASQGLVGSPASNDGARAP